MNTQSIAEKLVELCRSGKLQDAYDQLYSRDIISIEPDSFGEAAHVAGIEAVMEKLEQVAASVAEVHGTEVGDPIVASDHFTLRWKTELTYKGATERATIDEIAVYEVRDGLIVREQFFTDK